MIDELKPFLILLVFGNIENLILAAQGVAASVNPLGLAILSLTAASCWLLIGTFGTRFAIKYAHFLDFIKTFPPVIKRHRLPGYPRSRCSVMCGISPSNNNPRSSPRVRSSCRAYCYHGQ